MGGRELKLLLVGFILIAFLVAPSTSTMGYKITASVDSKTWQINRSTQNMDFFLTGSVSGSGNFSRYAYVQGSTGINAKELSSSTHGGRLVYLERMSLRSREGPVYVTFRGESANISTEDENQTSDLKYVETGYAKIEIDEQWPTLLTGDKRITYIGPVIRTSERYENNGDIVATSIESQQLLKESHYFSYVNRTMISTLITPEGVNEDRRYNKSTLYTLNSKSSGSLTHIDIIKSGSHGQVARTSEDYRGSQEINLRVRMDESIHPWDLSPRDWLPCCHGGYFDMSKGDRKFSSADKIFDCSCRNSSISRMSGGTGA